MSTYLYKDDNLTDPELKGKICKAVHRPEGKCIRARNSNMLVEFNGMPVIILARRLKKISY